MQLAINVVILAIGYLVAFQVLAKPIRFRKAVIHFITQLRLVTNGSKADTPLLERLKTALQFKDVHECQQLPHAELLTRLVTRYSIALMRLTHEQK